MGYTIDLGAWNSVFAVPCSVVDKSLKMAGSVHLKVLLWCLRHAGEPFEPQDVAAALGIDRADVGDAMLYWQESGLFSRGSSPAAPEPKAGEAEAPAAPPPEPPKPAAEPSRVLSRPQKPDSEFVAMRIAESTEIACLMQSAQQILGRLISGGESATLLMIHDDFGLPCDVIAMLLQYAASIGKANMRYIEKAAMNWADEEILTHEKAEEKLQKLAESRQAWHTVEQALGIPHRAPSTKEEAFAEQWVAGWKFGPDMLREAYDRAVDATGKFSASYMNRILERWNRAGIKTVKQAAEERMEHAAAKDRGKGKNLTFDIDEYERTSIYDTKR